MDADTLYMGGNNIRSNFMLETLQVSVQVWHSREPILSVLLSHDPMIISSMLSASKTTVKMILSLSTAPTLFCFVFKIHLALHIWKIENMIWIFVSKLKFCLNQILILNLMLMRMIAMGFWYFHPSEWFGKFHFRYVYSNRKNLIYPFNNLFNCPYLDVKQHSSFWFCILVPFISSTLGYHYFI